MSVYGNLISELRLKSGLSQANLANTLNLPRTIISMIETGARMPTEKQFKAINSLFNLSDDDLSEVLETSIIDEIQEMNTYNQLLILRKIEINQ